MKHSVLSTVTAVAALVLGCCDLLAGEPLDSISNDVNPCIAGASIYKTSSIR